MMSKIFESKITVGNLLTIGILVTSTIVGYATLQNQVVSNTARINALEVKVDTTLDEVKEEIAELRLEMTKEMGKISVQMARLNSKNETTEGRK